MPPETRTRRMSAILLLVASAWSLPGVALERVVEEESTAREHYLVTYDAKFETQALRSLERLGKVVEHGGDATKPEVVVDVPSDTDPRQFGRVTGVIGVGRINPCFRGDSDRREVLLPSARRTFPVETQEQWDAATRAALYGDVVIVKAAFQPSTLTFPAGPIRYTLSFEGHAGPNVPHLKLRGARNKSSVIRTGGQIVIYRSNIAVENLGVRAAFVDFNPTTNKCERKPAILVDKAGSLQWMQNLRLTDLHFVDAGPRQLFPGSTFGIWINNKYASGVPGTEVVYKIRDVRLDHSLFDRVQNAILVIVSNGVQGLRVDHNVFKNQPNCLANGCDVLQLGAGAYGKPGRDRPRYEMHALVDHNSFIGNQGESELISSKGFRTTFQYNYLADNRGSLNFRSGGEGFARGNVILRSSGAAVRVSAENIRIERNVVWNTSNKRPVALVQGNDEAADRAPNCTNANVPAFQYYTPARRVVVSGNHIYDASPLLDPWGTFEISGDNACGCGLPCNDPPEAYCGSGNVLDSNATSTPGVQALLQAESDEACLGIDDNGYAVRMCELTDAPNDRGVWLHDRVHLIYGSELPSGDETSSGKDASGYGAAQFACSP